MPIIHLSGQVNKHGWVENIEEETISNNDFRNVIYTAEHLQLVVMSLDVDEEIGEEVHGVDQFFRIEQGTGTVVISGKQTSIEAGTGIVVPAGCTHNIINTGDEPLKLYSIYSPPHHQKDTVHSTKSDAEGDKEEFDGQVTE